MRGERADVLTERAGGLLRNRSGGVRSRVFLAALGCACGLLALSPGEVRAAGPSFIGPFTPDPKPLATTVPLNGDVNPYGIATVPAT